MGKYIEMLERQNNKATKIRAIDPPWCECSECLVGEYKPLQAYITDEEKELTIAGEIANNTTLTIRQLATYFDLHEVS